MAKTRKRPRHFVLDGSVAMAWFFKDGYLHRQIGRQQLLDLARGCAGDLAPRDCKRVLMWERRGRSTEAQASRWLTYLRSLPVALDEETNQHAWGDVLHLGRAHQFSTYDAAYFELAV